MKCAENLTFCRSKTRAIDLAIKIEFKIARKIEKNSRSAAIHVSIFTKYLTVTSFQQCEALTLVLVSHTRVVEL